MELKIQSDGLAFNEAASVEADKTQARALVGGDPLDPSMKPPRLRRIKPETRPLVLLRAGTFNEAASVEADKTHFDFLVSELLRVLQ